MSLTRHLTAGPRALEGLSTLFALPRGARLSGACAHGGALVRVTLEVSGRRLELDLAPAEGEKGFALEPRGADGPAVRRLLAACAARMAAGAFVEALRRLESDPASFAESVDLDAPSERVRVPCMGQPMDLLEAGWRNFYADQDFEVLLGVPSNAGEKTLNVEYGDMECYYARPKRSFKKWSFLDWPEESEGGPAEESGEQSREGSIVAELEERDMILGTGERVDALVDEIKRRARPGDYLLFTHLCTPIIMGEDYQGLAKRCEKEVGGAAVHWSQKDRDENDNFGDHLRALLARPGFLDGAGDASAVNLYHFPKAVRDAEVRPALQALGLRTNLSAFPEVSFPALERMGGARWQVFCRRASYPTRLAELLEAAGRPVVYAEAPYGVEGTRRCLAGIAASAGRAEAFESYWSGLMDEFLPRWERLKARARGRRLGFVVSEATLPRLLELRYGYGAPLAAMVLEMGFGVDLLYYDRHGLPPALPPGLAGARVRTFRAPWELARALAEGEFEAAYSDVQFDWRLNRAGKARFSGKDFRMGLEGARSTLERLLEICETPFFRRYGAHLTAAPWREHVL